MNKTFYKTCAVPMCNNTSIHTPQKLFIHLPKKTTIRRKWLTLAGRLPNYLFPTTSEHFCEDHFDLPNDMENYMQYNIMGRVSHVRLKPGCLPSKFPGKPLVKNSTEICQPLEANSAECNKLVIKSEFDEEIPNEDISCQSAMANNSTVVDANSVDWIKIEVVRESEEEISSKEKSQPASSLTDNCRLLGDWNSLELKVECEEVMSTLKSSHNLKSQSQEQSCQSSIASTANNYFKPIVLEINRPRVKSEYEENITPAVAFGLRDNSNINIPSPYEVLQNGNPITKCDKAIQVHIRYEYPSKSTQTEIETRTTQTSPIRFSKKSVSTSPFKFIELPIHSRSSRKCKPNILRSRVKRKLYR